MDREFRINIDEIKGMDELDYMLLELNASDDERTINVKQRIKDRFDSLNRRISFEKKKYNILVKELFILVDKYVDDTKYYERIFNRLVSECAKNDDYITR
jgi:ElaB/YqjD/DUF883 family membrane-anchored ribosome-binding protein